MGAAAVLAAVTVFTVAGPAFASQLTASASSPLLADAAAGVDATRSGFVQAFSLVFVSELGDKTFFIAGLLAAKTSRFISFTGSVAALAVMTVISTLIGVAFHRIPAAFTSGLPFDDYIAVAAFLYFGLIALRDASQLPDDDNSGMEAEALEVRCVGSNNRQKTGVLHCTTRARFSGRLLGRHSLAAVFRAIQMSYQLLCMPSPLIVALHRTDYRIAATCCVFQAEESVKEIGGDISADGSSSSSGSGSGLSGKIKQAGTWALIVQTFGLVFAAEFGDRSFLTTIALSAAQNPFRYSLDTGSCMKYF